jgi:hypothetical protein
MNRKKFLAIAGTTVVTAAGIYYLGSDRNNFTRNDLKPKLHGNLPLRPDEIEILYLASLAPSGHNTQPWLVKYVEPYHWIIGNDKVKWLPGVDPTQRETILSIGAFLQNLQYAAVNFGYACQFTLLATSNQDENIMDVKLSKQNFNTPFDTQKIKLRRTVRSNYMNDVIKTADLNYIIDKEKDAVHFVPNTTKEYQWLNEQTIEANRIQAYRDAAQSELANWIRFSSKDAAQHCDGLTLAGMEIEGFSAWILRNFYSKENVMKKNFREQSIDKVKAQVNQSAGWLLITSKDTAVETLLETGMRMQRIFLKVRDKNIALHPMTQILEETNTAQTLQQSLGIDQPVQFMLRTGYLKNYPQPVSLRRPVDWFVHT